MSSALTLAVSACLAGSGVVSAFNVEYAKARIITKESLTRGRETMEVRHQPIPDDLPDAFDSRTNWPNCPSIADIWDQAACGDCWAVGAASAATDRMCIATNASNPPNNVNQTRLSVEQMVGCCTTCGFGCGEGFPNYAWDWLAGKKGKPYGLVSGGQYQDYRWCASYTLKPCNHFDSKNDTLPSCEKGPPDPTPKCVKECDAESNYNVSFAADNHQFKSSYAVPTAEAEIRAEIFAHGPVTAGMEVYSDWTGYTSGVYTCQGGQDLGGHAVRIIGWGVEGGQEYWTVANSFGVKWGDQGYFKILRGRGSCGIENSIVAGLYK